MEDIYRILIPTDFSETADHALDVGVTLGKRSDTEVHVLHIEDIPEDWVALVDKAEKSLYLGINEKIDVVKKELSDRVALAKNSGANVKEFLEYNKSYRAILGHAENYETDLIVMGAHGRSGFKGMLMGSYTQKVLYHTQVPVLVTKKTDVLNDLRSMVFVSDFNPEESSALHRSFELAKRMRIDLEVLFINTPSTFRETHDIHKRINKYMEGIPAGMIKKTSVINAYRFEEGLARHCEISDIDIISMPIYKKRQSWEAIGSTIEDVVNHIDLPVLGIPEVK